MTSHPNLFRASRIFLHTSREVAADAELVSHRLMLRAGMIRQQASGIYSWLPVGWRVVRRIERIVREEMDAAGAVECFLPAVQPADLWIESGRWEEYGPELLRLRDRHDREFCIGPTHEEVITEIVRAHVTGRRQLPFNLYQIQTKFRDEIRPRFGVMRAREFIMKDAYSFDVDADGMKESYRLMYEAYSRIFDRIGLRYRIVRAESGAIGGDYSHEFTVLADSGEEVIAYCDETGYAANVENVACPPDERRRPEPGEELRKVATPGVRTIAGLGEFLGGLPPERSLKTMIVSGEAGAAAVLLLGHHKLNLYKAARCPQIGAHPALATPERARELIGADFGSLGPIGMPLPVVADHAVMDAADFACGANENDMHYVGANFGRDCPEPERCDLRNAVEGDPTPDGKGILSMCRGIEVGHVFRLGDKYSKAMNAYVEVDGVGRPILMGCYGIGITRIVAAAIEQAHDDKGIVFPDAIAPYRAAVLPINGAQSAKAAEAAGELALALAEAGFDVLLDDRDVRPGFMFAEAELIGVPHRFAVGERDLADGVVEYRDRASGESVRIAPAEAAAFLQGRTSARKG